MSAPALFARTWGEGPPVVLLHGLGASSRYWEPLAEASSGYAAVAPDLLRRCAALNQRRRGTAPVITGDGVP